MFTNFIKVFFSFLLLVNIALAGGSTVVGDGGFIADCKRNAYFVDRLEYLIKNNWQDVPGNRSRKSFREDMKVTTAAIIKDYSLNLKASQALFKAVRNVQFLQRPMRNPYEGVFDLAGVEVHLRTSKIKFDDRLISFVENNNCKIVAGATKINSDEAITYGMSDACISVSPKECIVIDRLLFKELSLRDQRCLMTHELLRLVPNSFANEAELRSLTMKYCSL